jgi:hypothetical protein
VWSDAAAGDHGVTRARGARRDRSTMTVCGRVPDPRTASRY